MQCHTLVVVIVWAVLLGGCDLAVSPSTRIPTSASERSTARVEPTIAPTPRPTVTPMPTRTFVGPWIDLSLPQSWNYCPFIPRLPGTTEIAYEASQGRGIVERKATYFSAASEQAISEWLMKALSLSGWVLDLHPNSDMDMSFHYNYPENIYAPPVTVLDIYLIPLPDVEGTTIIMDFGMEDAHTSATWCLDVRP